jgi:transposase
MLRIHLLQQWYSLSDPAKEEALIEVSTMRRFAGIELISDRNPDESTILTFRHLLEMHCLGEQIFDTERLRSDAAFASLCGFSPLPASSEKTNRYRLNRGGNRQANATLHRIVVVCLRLHEQTKGYAARRLKEGRSKAEIMRCLKRSIARAVLHTLLGRSL